MKSNRKKEIILTIIFIFVAFGALPAGYSMIVQPDGNGLGMSLELLKNSPFSSFFIPGIFLFIGNGLLNLLAAILCYKKFKYSAYLGLFLGTYLLTWILVQVFYVGLSSWMQPAFFIIGINEIIISFLMLKQSKKLIMAVN